MTCQLEAGFCPPEKHFRGKPHPHWPRFAAGTRRKGKKKTSVKREPYGEHDHHCAQAQRYQRKQKNLAVPKVARSFASREGSRTQKSRHVVLVRVETYKYPVASDNFHVEKRILRDFFVRFLERLFDFTEATLS